MSGGAYQANGLHIEREGFYALACDPRRSCVVEACAGAGKTWMLVSRILRALLGGAQAHEILAITFTRKAAGEMRERLNEWLRAFSTPHATDSERVAALLARGVPIDAATALAPELAGLHERLLREGRAVQVSTFHAWFAQLLAVAPLELLSTLGLQQNMSLIEDLDDHRPEVFRRFHAALLRDPSLQADHAALIARRRRSQVRAWFDAVWEKRVEFELADEAGVLEGSVEPVAGVDVPADADDAWHPAHLLHSDPWRHTLRELAADLARGNAAARKAGAGITQALTLTEPPATFEACWEALFTQKREVRKLGQIALLDEACEQFNVLDEQIRQHEARIEHLRLVRLSRVLLGELSAYKRSRGLAEMADLERCGLALLRDHTLSAWVQERLDARVRHLLIDEFQDTSPLQWQALHAWLSAYAGAGGGASGQRAPGVFIVGDPKQSIYRFRRADPRVFAAARDFVVEGLGGDLLACDHTRRNTPELTGAINAVFLEAQREAAFDGFRAHTTEVASRGGVPVLALERVLRAPASARGAVGPPVWRDTLTTPRREPETMLREQEAARVADAIQTLLAEQRFEPSEIFVLSRKRQSLRMVARAMQQRQLPCAAGEEMPLMDAIEARDLIALLDALVSPSHRLSLAQALRCPLFGADDDALIALAESAQGSHGGHWWAALLQDDVLSAHPSLQRARHWLPRWQSAASQLPPHDLLDRIVHEGEYRERVAATVPPLQRAAALDAIDALLAQALLLDGARYATPYGFVRSLKRRAVKVSAPVQADAVQLLTVHGAKGLEARAVFVMDAEPELPRAVTATLLIDWPVDDERPRRCAFLYAESSPPPSLRLSMCDELQAREREELNGLYVAMSRAKELLVFSATEPMRAAPGASWWTRVTPLAVPWVPAVDVPVHEAGAVDRAAPSAMPFPMRSLGAPWQVRTDEPAEADIEPASAASRLGQAVHRVLEWATGSGAGSAAIGELAQAAAEEFDAPAGAVANFARTILESRACRRFFDAPGLRWAGNEVPIADGGELLRIDRLVQLDSDEGPVWWVLDYKLAHAPAELASYRDQLRRYQHAVQRLQAGALVRSAFVTGEGMVIELDPPAPDPG